MAEKTFNGRIINKNDTEENWLKATNFIPKKGELIVYNPDSTYTYARLKVGDGSTGVNSLMFIGDVDLTALTTMLGEVLV